MCERENVAAVEGFPGRLERLRVRRGLSRRLLAEQSGVHYDTVVKLESGRRSPTLRVVAALATALGVDVRELLRG